LIMAKVYTIGVRNQPRLREATMVITVQIIRLTIAPILSRLRFCPVLTSKIRCCRAMAWQTNAATAEIKASRRYALFFLSRLGMISPRLIR